MNTNLQANNGAVVNVANQNPNAGNTALNANLDTGPMTHCSALKK
ncbi:MAG: hypothetical protein NTX98_01780 [Candidatus Doudnabacteria bacterium]|nr:hypothetical protein [Candidatus Doudnabacteria bacterium]